MYLLAVTYEFFGIFLMGYFKTFGSTKINNDTYLTVVGSIGAALNGIGRIVIGILLDYYSFHRVFGFLALL